MAEYRNSMMANAYGLDFNKKYDKNIWNPRNK